MNFFCVYSSLFCASGRFFLFFFCLKYKNMNYKLTKKTKKKQ
uniref:Uncharacterized protein n=1 Tax=Klebsiella pneumoniae subsp. pneumoniae TaxID=72407 RepID=A0A8F7KSB0_KLEPN|nr:hypothetical protein [Klebsiella pneumoniae subsp. pneumoniae]